MWLPCVLCGLTFASIFGLAIATAVAFYRETH